MKTQHPKLKTQPRQLFSCGFFGHCTQTVLSPTTPTPPSIPLSSPPPSPPPPPPPLPAPPLPHTHPPPKKSHHQAESSSSSSSSTSQSFTQWRFPVANSPHHHHQPDPQPGSDSNIDQTLPTNPPPLPPPSAANLQELFHVAEVQLNTGSESEQLSALFLLERSLVPNPPSDPVCSPELMKGVVAKLKNKAGVKSATKILLALCLAEGNRHVAVEAGAVGTVVEVVMEMEGAAAERALAALELTCTVAEGEAELRSHALAVPVMVTMMGKMSGRGREYAISALAVVYGGGSGGGGSESEKYFQLAPPEEVARAVVLALQGDCTARGKRKGTQLLTTLKEYGRVDLTEGKQDTTRRLYSSAVLILSQKYHGCCLVSFSNRKKRWREIVAEKMEKRYIKWREKREDKFMDHGKKYEFGDITWYPSRHTAVYRSDDRVPLNVSGDVVSDFIGFQSNLILISQATRSAEKSLEKAGNVMGKCMTASTFLGTRKLVANGFKNGPIFTGYPVVGRPGKMQTSGTCLYSTSIATSCSWDPRINGLFFYETTAIFPASKFEDFIRDVKKLQSMKPKNFCGIDIFNGLLIRFIKASQAYLGQAEDFVVLMMDIAVHEMGISVNQVLFVHAT